VVLSEVGTKAPPNHSVISWEHINLLGEYDFSDEKLRDSVRSWLHQAGGWLLPDRGVMRDITDEVDRIVTLRMNRGIRQ
jgi:hypothetical protein